MNRFRDKPSKIKLHFARHAVTNEWVSVYNSPTGNNTNCICPVCKSPVGAKNKDKSLTLVLQKHQRTAHFYHINNSNCKANGESVYHEVAKEIFYNSKLLFIPTSYKGYESLVGSSKIVEFETVVLENRIDFETNHIVADAVGTINGNRLLIEFAVTNFAKIKKIDFLKKAKYDCLEIDINPIRKGIDTNNIELIYKRISTYLLSSKELKYTWLFNNNFHKYFPQIKKEEIEKRDTAIKKITELQAEIDQIMKEYFLSKEDLI